MKNRTIEELRKLNTAKHRARALLAAIRRMHPEAAAMASLVDAELEKLHEPALRLVQHLHAGATAARETAERALGE